MNQSFHHPYNIYRVFVVTEMRVGRVFTDLQNFKDIPRCMILKTYCLVFLIIHMLLDFFSRKNTNTSNAISTKVNAILNGLLKS